VEVIEVVVMRAPCDRNTSDRILNIETHLLYK
jgi:hypothetical protein